MLKLPVSYAIRNLRRRPWHSVMTAGGVGIVVFASVLMLSLNRGLARRIDASGDSRNILVISRAGQNMMFSSIAQDELVDLSAMPGVSLDADDNLLVSPEVMQMETVSVATETGPVRSAVYVRGVTPTAYHVHTSLSILEGRLPEAENEVLFGRTTHVKLGVPLEAVALDKTIAFEGQDWTVVGRFEAGGSLIESEIWMQKDTLNRILKRRTDTFAVVRMTDVAAVEAALPLFHETGSLERYFKGWSERDFYRDFGSALSWILWLSAVMVVIITFTGALIGTNTMYAAVMNRMREISTYRVLGFGKSDVVVAFLIESTVLAMIGGGAGLLAGMTINGLPLSLSYGAFYLVVDSTVVLVALGLSVFVGIVGGVFPAMKGLNRSIIDGLRHG